MVTVAECKLGNVGSKTRLKLVLAPTTTLLAGSRLTLKAPAPSPLSSTNGLPVRLSGPEPALLMLKLRVTWPLTTVMLPKSVPSPLLGVASSAAMAWPLPLRVREGTGM